MHGVVADCALLQCCIVNIGDYTYDMTKRSAQLKPLSSSPRWFDELPLAARLVLAIDDFASEWGAVLLTLIVGAGAVGAAPTVTRIFDPSASSISPASSVVYAALFVGVPALAACAFIIVPRARDRAASFRLDDEELRAGLWQLGVLSPSLFLKRYPQRIQAYHDLGNAIVKAIGVRQETRRSVFGVSLLAFAVEDPDALERVRDVVAERGLLAPAEVARLAVAGKNCRPLSGGAL